MTDEYITDADLLPPGTRIEFVPDGEEEWITGTIVEPSEIDEQRGDGWLFIKRDDDLAGGGSNGEWLIAREGILLKDRKVIIRSPHPTWTAFPKSTPAHVAGLDPETIDPEAYRDFMRSL